MSTTGANLLHHFETLDATPLPPLPDGVEWLNPLRTYPETRVVFQAFLERFYADEAPRTLILGINPGRFGGGITNIAFTDPVLLEQVYGISNGFEKRAELSAQFVHRVIDAYGGSAAFYQRYYINSICPLGFVKGGKNYNYYDENPSRPPCCRSSGNTSKACCATAAPIPPAVSASARAKILLFCKN